MSGIVFNLFGCSQYNESVFKSLGFALGDCQIHDFPDGESLIRINTNVKDQVVIFSADLYNPNAKLLPLVLAVETVKALGAKSVHLLTPYLPYMRQDKQFHSNEGITSHYFAKLLSQYIDSLLTVEPHLHRIKSLSEIYRIPAMALKAHQPIANWLMNRIKKPLLIGPDRESEQWVVSIAKLINAPHVIFDKVRQGDHHVEINTPDLKDFAGFEPVIIDDVISTGQTMIKVMKYLQQNHFQKLTCLGVHALFVDDAYENLKSQGANMVVTCNTRLHPSNQIDMSHVIIESMKKLNKRA